jgi:hypothetical protein
MMQQDNKIQLNVGDFVKYECGAMTDEIKLDHIDNEDFFVNKSGGKGFLYLRQITHINSEAVDWQKITVSDNIKKVINDSE